MMLLHVPDVEFERQSLTSNYICGSLWSNLGLLNAV